MSRTVLATCSLAALIAASALAEPRPFSFDGGEGDGDGDKGSAFDLSDPKIKAFVDEAVATATSGLAKKKEELLGEKKKLQSEFETFKQQFEGVDPEHVKNLMKRMETDETTRLLAEGKIDEVLEKRTTALKSDYEKKLEAANAKLSEYEKTLSTKDATIHNMVVSTAVRDAAGELGAVQFAVPDIVQRAKAIFSLDEKGNVIARDGEGALILGKNGRDSLTVAEWLDSMKEKAPHWFPQSTGGGAGGGKGGQGGTHSITRSDARDHGKYKAAKEAAQKAGVELQIVEG